MLLMPLVEKLFLCLINMDCVSMYLLGTFGTTFYTKAKDHLTTFLELCDKVDDVKFLAKLAITGRQQGYMKDTPVALMVVLASRRETDLIKQIWPQVVGRNIRKMRHNAFTFDGKYVASLSGRILMINRTR